MTLSLQQPATLAPEELDAYLAAGWYRVGLSMMTCRYLLTHDEVRSTVWTRTRLAGHQFSRSARKLLSRNDRRFRLEVRPALPDLAREALYQRYVAHVGGERSSSLLDFLGGAPAASLFSTEELGVWEGDRLVAFSWFDQGVDSLQSLTGVYDPAEADASLGVYTLLCEVRLAQARGLAFHYSGYVVIGDPCMDYKLRAGGIEFLDDRSSQWLPWQAFNPAQAPLERILARLELAQIYLGMAGIPHRLERYAGFDLPARHRELRGCLEEPALLTIAVGPASTLLVTAPAEGYRVDLGQRAQVRFTSVARPQDPPRTVPLWVPAQRLGEGLTLDQLVRGLQRARVA